MLRPVLTMILAAQPTFPRRVRQSDVECKSSDYDDFTLFAAAICIKISPDDDYEGDCDDEQQWQL